MISPASISLHHSDNYPDHYPDPMTEANTEQQRLCAIHELDLLSSESIPVFDEATQTAAHFLGSPICILSIADRDRQYFKAAIGLSRIGLMNELATSRQIARRDSFCNYVIERMQILAIEDATQHPDYQTIRLVKRYGIRSYLGVPVITSHGYCAGTLAVMELVPRVFSGKEIAFLELIARWSMSEFERNRVLSHPTSSIQPQSVQPGLNQSGLNQTTAESSLDDTPQEPNRNVCYVKANLIAQMSQELRTPLTSIIGMTSVLNREIYGPLTDKQKEYLDIVHNSSQYMHSLVNEILELGDLKEKQQSLDLSPVDVEMLCQQSLATLEQAAKRREQNISLTVEPGRRVWLLDKNKVRQLLYHIVFRVIQSSNAGSTIRVHVSRKSKYLNLSIWTSHPWLDEGIPHTPMYTSTPSANLLTPDALTALPPPANLTGTDGAHYKGLDKGDYGFTDDIPLGGEATGDTNENDEDGSDQIRQHLGFMLSQTLAELHGGSISLQGTVESGYRYVIALPKLDTRNVDDEDE